MSAYRWIESGVNGRRDLSPPVPDLDVIVYLHFTGLVGQVEERDLQGPEKPTTITVYVLVYL